MVTSVLFFAWMWSIIGKNIKLWFILWPAYILACAIIVPSYQSCKNCFEFNWLTSMMVAAIGYPIVSFLFLGLTQFSGTNSVATQKKTMSVYNAMCFLNQRATGRNMGADIHATLKSGCDWAEWKYASYIWEMEQGGNNYGVTVSFEHPDYIPTYDRGGYIVPSNPSVFRGSNYQGNNQITAEEIVENRWKTW